LGLGLPCVDWLVMPRPNRGNYGKVLATKELTALATEQGL